MKRIQIIAFAGLFIFPLFSSYSTVSLGMFYLTFFVLVIVVVWGKGSGLNLSSASFSALFIFISLVVRLFLQGNVYGTGSIYSLLVYWLLFFILMFLFNRERKYVNVIAKVVILTTVIELLFGFMQLFGWANNGNDYFRLGGSFGNPSVYSGYLCAISPLLLSLYLTYRKQKRFDNFCYILVTCLILIVYMLFISRSRAAWIAFVLGCFAVVNSRYTLLHRIKQMLPSMKQRLLLITGFLTLMTPIGYLLYLWKADSAAGRLLVWKVSKIVNCSYGGGIGRFEANYGKWQSDYFAQTGGTASERFIADYVTCPYNEFLRIYIDEGCWVLFLFAWFLFALLKNDQKPKYSLGIGARASLIAIIVLMFFSYPFEVPSIYLYFIFCAAALVYEPIKRKQISLKWAKWCFPVVAVAIAMIALYNVYGYFLLEKGQKYVFSGQLDKGIDTYRKAMPILNNNGILHFYCGSAFSLRQDYEAAIRELKLSNEKSSNPNSYILLGNNYKAIGETEKAKEAYLIVINMIPSKLYPKYLLVKLLVENQKYEEAEKWAREIVDAKEKVPTTAGKEIKDEMRMFLNKNDNNHKSKTYE